MIKVNNQKGWTFGAEHELADWFYNGDLPAGFERDRNDVTIVNSNGIANDPKGKMWTRGGEINTRPTCTILQQLEDLERFMAMHPDAKVNYRSNLHIHVRVPGLGEDLQALKRVQSYIHEHMPRVLEQIEPIPRPTSEEHPDPEELEGALRRWRRRRVSHHTLLTPERLQGQLEATSVEEFYRLEVPSSRKGTPMWHFQPRLCVNLRQHRETDTVEFRHFPGTLNGFQLTTCYLWCANFLVWALEDRPITSLLGLNRFHRASFPVFPKYDHQLERRYRATCHDHTLSKAEIKSNIGRILSGEFDALERDI